jgi:exonuclease III
MKQNINSDIFYKKYLTYKNKYIQLKNIQLKNQLGGVVCPLATLNMKLDVEDIKDCNNVRARGTVKIDNMSEEDQKAARRKGYITDNLHYNCYIKEHNNGESTVYNIKGSKKINNQFKIATYNIMGIDTSREKKELIRRRIPLIASEIIDNDIDIVCFQEMSYTSYIELREELKDYEIWDFIEKGDMNFFMNHKRGHAIECAVAIKRGLYPKKIIIEPIGGNITYTNSLLIVEFPNLVIFNCYLQAGTKFSPGLSSIYLHYARCRQQLLQYIIDKVKEYESKPCIILGDFNIDLNSSPEDFPDIQYINKLKELEFKDNWKETHRELGLTEDTDTNIMRWNDKFTKKQARVDGIFSRGLNIIDAKIIGIKSILIEESDPYNIEFIKHFTAPDDINNPKLRKIDGKVPIFASDHYGLMSTLEIIRQ